LVTANSSANTISVLLGNGNGTFGSKIDFPTGNAPTSVVMGTFNAGSVLDLAVVNQNGDTISVLLGNGDGTFGPKTDFVTAAMPHWLIVADFNDDGKQDLASANPGSNTVSVLLGNGDGTFAARKDFATGAFPRSLVAADFRKMMKLDLATANTSDGTASILLGKGDGTFDPRTDLGTDTEPQAITSADFDNDGNPDLLTGNTGYSGYSYCYFGCYNFFFHPTISLLPGRGDGTFASRVDFSLGLSSAQDPVSVATADFNGDGRIDVVVANASSGTVSVLLQSARVSFSTGSLSFPGNQPIGTPTAPQTVTVFSTGAVNAVMGAATVVGQNAGDFGVLADSCSGMSFAPGSNCDLQVAFTPSTSGVRTAELRIPHNGEGSDTVSLSGVGLGNGIVSPSPASLDFGDQPINVPSTLRRVTITNTGTGSLTLLNITRNGEFELMNNNCQPAPLAANASCSFDAFFQPSSPGAKSGSIRIDSDTAASPNTVPLTGNGIPAPNVSLSPISLSFAGQLVGTSSQPRTITLTTSGTGTLVISSISADPDFSIMHNCPSSLMGGSGCTINVTFRPNSPGLRGASLVIAHNAAGQPNSVSLSGNGMDFAVQPADGSTLERTITAGQTANFALSLIAIGGFSGSATVNCIGVIPGGKCSVSPASVTFSEAMPASVMVTVNTTGRGIAVPRGGPQIPPVPIPLWTLWLALALTLLGLTGWLWHNTGAGKPRLRPARLLLAVPLLMLILLFTGCSGGRETPPTPPGTYSITVNAAAGGAARSTTLTIVVR
jgi:hypothetical protein